MSSAIELVNTESGGKSCIVHIIALLIFQLLCLLLYRVKAAAENKRVDAVINANLRGIVV